MARVVNVLPASTGNVTVTTTETNLLAPASAITAGALTNGVPLTNVDAYVEIQAKEILSLRKRLNDIYVHHTGQPLEKVEQALERDKFMSPDDAKAFGIIDEVVTSRPPRPEDVKAAD